MRFLKHPFPFVLKDFSFLPESYILPSQRPLLEAHMKDSRSESKGPCIWICKPPNAHCGRGIKLVSNISEIPVDEETMIVSRYIHNPFLINGFKFDLRIYVVATSFDPMRFYIYDQGLVRFATQT